MDGPRGIFLETMWRKGAWDMGRWFRAPWTRHDGSTEGYVVEPEEGPWHEVVVKTARLHGAMPYVVEGFMEVTEAVRRGHPVVVRKERAEVADGHYVFDDVAPADDEAVVTITRFDLGTARFVVQDPESAMGGVQLTPRRLQEYMSSPGRSVGVALGG